MAMADLALHGTKKPVSLSEISERQGLPLTYLEQLFNKLRRQGLVASTRGQAGGYQLSKEAQLINIMDIMKAVDEPIKATRCDMKAAHGCQGISGRCITHHLWQGLSLQIAEYLSATTLADLQKKYKDLGGRL